MPINRAPFNALIDDDGSGTTGSVWNKTAIAGVLLDPIDAMWTNVAPDLVFNANGTIRRDTADGADTGTIALCGGGAAGQLRGSHVACHGNESYAPGQIEVALGNVAGANLRVHRSSGAVALNLDGATGTLSLSATGVPQARFDTTAAGSYVNLANAGVDYGFFGSALTILGALTNTDLAIFATGALVLASGPQAIYAVPVYSTTNAAAANVVVLSDGRLARSTSSRRYKTAITPLTEWDTVLRLEPVSFTALQGGTRHVGLIAEQVADVDSRLVVCDVQGQPDEVAYAHLTAPIIAAIHALHARLVALERTPAHDV